MSQSRDCRKTLIYAHTTSRTLPTCDISLGSLTLTAPEAGDFVELIVHYFFTFMIVGIFFNKFVNIVFSNENNHITFIIMISLFGVTSCMSCIKYIEGNKRTGVFLQLTVIFWSTHMI